MPTQQSTATGTTTPVPNPDVAARIKNDAPAKLMKRWHSIIEIVRKELTWLNHQRSVMDAVTDVVNGNPYLLQHHCRQFFDYVRTWYGGAMAIGYRRQVDPDERSASLRVLLEELLARPDAYCLEALRPFMGRATDETIRNFVMEAVCVPRAGVLDVAAVATHLDDLASAGHAVKRYVNKLYAHTDIGASSSGEPGPTFDQIINALAETERIAARWITAITGDAVLRFAPVDQFDWIDAFDRPWRTTRPQDSPDTKRFIVSLNTIVTEEDLENLYETADGRKSAHDDALQKLLWKAQWLAVDDRITSEFVPPSLVSVERIK